MTTKARRSEQIRCLARLLAQARLNAGDANVRRDALGYTAWLDVAAFLEGALWAARGGRGLPTQPRLLYVDADGAGDALGGDA